jgi:signal transduction histidine kinase
VSNAVKYSPEGKKIFISLEYTYRELIFTVRDQGIGIPEADLNRLFEPFHRAANVGTISGTGLGLSITKEAVELHGGSIDVDSAVGVGTTITVIIPFSNQNEDDDDKNPGH